MVQRFGNLKRIIDYLAVLQIFIIMYMRVNNRGENMKSQKKTEFSKKIFTTVISLFLLVILYAMALMWRIRTTDGLVYLITSVAGLATTTIGFYFWKAKMENMVKLSKENQMTMDEIKDVEKDIKDYEVSINNGGM